MEFGLIDLWKLLMLRWHGLAEIAGLAGAVVLLGCRMQGKARLRRREELFREESEAYACLDLRLPRDGGMEELAERICRLVAEKSAFQRIAMLLPGADGRMCVKASVGMESWTVLALNVWSNSVSGEERGLAGLRRGGAPVGLRVGNNGFAVVLSHGMVEGGGGRAIVVPLWSTAGRILGALVVCADGMMSVRRRVLEEALLPLEGIVARLGRTMENAALAERLLRAERLAGLGLMAGGVARALNDPLTAVLGFAELIAGTSEELRVKSDARTIVREALRMRETVDLLLEFWQPSKRGVEAVRIEDLLREVGEACRVKLAGRGVRLVVEAGAGSLVVQGSRDRLRQVLEHLLNNAAQAVASVGGEGHTVRLAAVEEGQRMQVMVSDTGPGFQEPGRVFDPFQAALEPGLGLSLCYGIVREHGGEISAYNLHPRGATVVVELPAVQLVQEKISVVVRDKVKAVHD